MNPLLLIAAVSLAAAASPQSTPGPQDTQKQERVLLAYTETGAGFGDKMQSYRMMLALASRTQRTAILPPFQTTIVDYSPLKDADFAKDGIEGLRKILRKVSGQRDEWVGSFALPRSAWLVPVDRWFNLTKLQQISSVPVRTLASWHTVSGGEIDLAVVPSKPHGCLPYHPHCETTSIKHGVNLNRALRTLHVATMECDNVQELHAGPFGETVEGFEEHLLGALQTPARRATPALALDGFCLALHPPVTEAKRQEIAASFRFADGVLQIVERFLEERHIRHYLAVHWRRSDVLIDHTQYYHHHTPHRVVALLKRHLGAQLARSPRVDAVVLLTDNFLSKELEAFKDAVQKELSLPVHRFAAGADLTLLPTPPAALLGHALSPPIESSSGPDAKAWLADLVAIDIALGARADWFAFTSGGSFYSNFIVQQRSNFGRAQETSMPLPLYDPRAGDDL